MSSFKKKEERRESNAPKKTLAHSFLQKKIRVSTQELQLERRIMEDKTKDYKQQTIKKFMVNRSKESQSSHDAQKSSDVSNGGTRSINDDKTRQDKKWKNENGDTVFIDPTLEEDEVEKKEDTHLGKRDRDDDVIIITGEGEVEEKKGTSLKERVRGGRESLVEDRPSSENSSE